MQVTSQSSNQQQFAHVCAAAPLLKGLFAIALGVGSCVAVRKLGRLNWTASIGVGVGTTAVAGALFWRCRFGSAPASAAVELEPREPRSELLLYRHVVGERPNERYGQQIERGRRALQILPEGELSRHIGAHLSDLTQLIRAERIRLLRGEECEATYNQMVHLMERLGPDGEAMESYLHYQSAEHRLDPQWRWHPPRSIFPHCTLPVEQYRSFDEFLEEWMEFRRAYLCMHGTEGLIAKPELSEEDMELLQLNFFHGTSSAILPSLPLVDHQLIAYGDLKAIGVVPLCGELGNGAGAGGVNHTMLSGCNPRDLELARRYVSDRVIDKEGCQKAIERFLEREEAEIESLQDIYHTGNRVAALGLHIRRARLFDPQWEREDHSRLKQHLERLRDSFEAFKKTEKFREHMPTRLGSQYGWHDDYHYIHLVTMEVALKEALEAFECPLKRPDTIPDTAFGMMIASRTAYAVKVGDSEVGGIHPLQLGTDIPVIFTNHQEKLQEWLGQHGIELMVYPLTKLERVADLHEIAYRELYKFA